MWRWRGDRKHLMTLMLGRGQVHKHEMMREANVELQRNPDETKGPRLTEDVIRGWNEAFGINLSIPKIRMIVSSRSRQTLSPRSISELFCLERHGSYISTFTKSEKKVLLGRGEEKRAEFKNKPRWQKKKADHHHDRGHKEEEKGGGKRFILIVKYITSTA